MLLTLGIGQVWAQNVIYTLDGTVTGGSNGYADASTITQNSVSWSVVGNTTVSPWRIGGKSLTNVDRTIASTTAISFGVSKVVVTHGTASSVTVNSLKLIVASDKSFSNVVSTLTGTFTANSSTTFECPADADWTNMFYKLVYNVKITSTSNKYLQFKSAAFYEAAPKPGDDVIVKTLKSISVEGMTTDYEQGDLFSFDGTCTATYSVTKNDVAQEDETRTVTPTVSTPDMNQLGDQTITVTYKDGDETATTTYTINVTENVVTPGTYTGNLNNTFFGCATGNNATEQSGKFDDVLVIAGCASNAQTKTNYQSGHVRFYKDSYLQLSVPSGYVIKSIVFTADGDWNGSITATVGAYDNNSKTWTGNVQEVKFSFGAQNRIKNVKVTYAADVKYALNITTPSNGTLVVKDGSAVLADDAQVYEGTKLVVTPTPNAGYVFESLTVGEETVELTDGSYTFNMPAADVTISATFKANEKPAATLTLSKNGVEEDITGNKQDDVVTLPSITSACVKQFVGWSADPNCATEPEYKVGDEYTLESTTQTLYAVYADENNAAKEEVYTFTEFTQANTVAIEAPESFTITLLKGTASTAPQWNSGSSQARVYAKGSLVISADAPISKIVYTYVVNKNNNGVEPTIDGVSGNNNAGNWDASAKTWTGNDTEVTFSTSGTAGNVGFTKVAVTVGAITYSNYSTTCAAALEKPTFSVAEGNYTEAKSIELNATEGDVYYTLDGTEPTKSSTPYTAAIDLDECGTTTIKAIAINTESQSPIASATYTINLPITNTAATAYTPAEAIAIIDGECDKTEEVFVKGVVVSTSAFSAEYGNYDVIVKAVDNSATPTTFTFYRMYKAASETKFTASDEVIGIGDIITAKGKLTKYKSTYELAEGCYMVEREAFTEPKTDISNTLETAYTVDKAFELISDVKSDLDKEVYVKGLVAVASTQLYEEKYLTYSISDNGQTTGNVLKVYDGLDIGGVAFTSKDDVNAGDYVVVKGKLFNYGGTYEINKDNQLVQHKKAAAITIADITMEVGETKTIAATVEPAEAEVTYTIKKNEANAISLSGNVITANAVGTATITATATAADYMGKTIDFTVTVNAKSTKEKVVILAEYEGQWYAMKAQYVTGRTSHLAPLPVTYFDGKLYNVNEADKALIEWERAVVDGKATFYNDGKYLTGKSGDTDLTLAATACEWTISEDSYLIGARTFLYNAENNWFRNFGTGNAGDKNYSDMPTVTAPVYVNLNTSSVKTVEKGIFSVADGKFVQFSTGNLQYEVGTNTWSFASEQYEVIGGKAYTGSNNTNYGMNVPGYTGKLDLFAWSCDGKFGVNPSNADADYTGEFADWGDLVNEEGWYTLTKKEMNYILNRKKDGKKLWALATINDKVGLILLPDNWNTSIDLEYGYVPEQFVYTKNLLSIPEWQTLEENGAVFLPAAGSRTGGYGNKESAGGSGTFNADGDYFHVDNVNIYGYYWLNTQDTRPAYPHCASYLILPGWSEGPTVDAEGVDDLSTPPAIWSREKRRGNSVRLVKKVTPNYTREVRPGYYGTICLENGGQMIGASLFELSYYNEAQGLLYMDEADDATMVAGNPYVFLPNERATNNTLYVFYDETTSDVALTVKGLVGYLGNENMQLPGDGTNYILQDNKIKKVVGGNNSNVFVTKNRAYIQLGSVNKNEPAPVPGRRRVAIGQAPQVATGMESVDASAQPVKMIIDGQLYILRGEKMYDAQGKLVK